MFGPENGTDKKTALKSIMGCVSLGQAQSSYQVVFNLRSSSCIYGQVAFIFRSKFGFLPRYRAVGFCGVRNSLLIHI